MEKIEDKCVKCGSPMTKSGIMESGNSKYIKLTCKKCGHNTMKCSGVMLK